jgi:hypothetical protein
MPLSFLNAALISSRMVRLLSLTVVLLVVSAQAFGAPLSMVCTNPRQPYQVTYDGAASFAVASAGAATKYLPLTFEKTRRTAVSGMVGNGSGLGFYAEFSPHKRIELYQDAKLVQTDECK